MPGGEELSLVGCLPRRSGAHSGDARRVDHALDASPKRLLEHDAGAAHVDLEEPLVVAGAHRDEARDVEDPVDAAHRAANRGPIEDVALHRLVLDPLELLQTRAPPLRQPQVVAALGEQAHNGPAGEPVAARDERLALT